jgi:hypothetical protein
VIGDEAALAPTPGKIFMRISFKNYFTIERFLSGNSKDVEE